ncbi:unnamed protein product [Menidia menidia]|nr:unnamed protein product [Menidia menidia]
MSSFRPWRDFIRQRLTAAGEETFAAFEDKIVQFEEQISHQRRKLDAVLIPDVRVPRIDIPQQHDFKEEEALPDQQHLDPKLMSIKEEPEDPCTSQEGEPLSRSNKVFTRMKATTSGESQMDNEPDAQKSGRTKLCARGNAVGLNLSGSRRRSGSRARRARFVHAAGCQSGNFSTAGDAQRESEPPGLEHYLEEYSQKKADFH